jgi:hypothetical protein
VTAVEAQPWLAGLKQLTGLDWSHRVDHRARDEFKVIVQGYELHVWSTGRWAVYTPNGNGTLQPGNRTFQTALDQVQAELHRRMSSGEDD